MYLLNVSFMVNPKVYTQWVSFINDKFMPLVSSQSEFDRVTFSKVLSATVEDHHIFSLLIEFDTLDGYNLFQNEIMGQYLEIASPLFGTNTSHFITLMKKM